MYIRIYTLRQIHSFTLSIMPSLDRIHSILFLCKVLPIISLYRSANESHYLPRPFSELFFLLFLACHFFSLFRHSAVLSDGSKKKHTLIYTERDREKWAREKWFIRVCYEFVIAFYVCWSHFSMWCWSCKRTKSHKNWRMKRCFTRV